MARTRRRTLYHYTTAEGLAGILTSKRLNASTRKTSPKDIRYGNGQYLTDLVPGTLTPAQLARALVGLPFALHWFTHYAEIEVTGLRVVKGREHVFVVPNNRALSLNKRIVSSGPVEGS